MNITCGIFLVDPKNRLLVCHPTGTAWNCMSIPKGVPEPNETYVDAMIRELFEETGLILDNLSGHLKEIENLVPYSHGKKSLKAFIFRSEIEILDNLQCASFFQKNGKEIPEVDDYKWLSWPELEIFKVHPTQEQIIIEHLL